jgi:hypothetical protein
MTPRISWFASSLGLIIFLTSSILTPLGVASSGAATPLVSLCTVQTQVTSLRVSRGIPENPETFIFRRLIFVNREVSAQSVATALCALPTMPTGPLSCAADFGFNYSLLFSAPGVEVTDVRFDPTGCQKVTGLGALRWVEQTPGFDQVLGSAMKLKHASYSTFTGKWK